MHLMKIHTEQKFRNDNWKTYNRRKRDWTVFIMF